MLFKGALVLLLAWAAGMFGAFDLGGLLHVLLLVGLMLLLLSLLKARDAATGGGPGSDAGHR